MNKAQSIKVSLPNISVHPLVKILAGSFFIALLAQIRVPIPFHPIPLTGQTLAILFLGVTLGSKQAMGSAVLYLVESLLGLPVLAGGAMSPAALFGITGGYLVAMPFAAYIAGYVSTEKSTIYNFMMLAFALTTVLLFGAVVFASFVGWQNAFTLGVYPFIPGELIKILLVLSLMKSARHFE